MYNLKLILIEQFKALDEMCGILESENSAIEQFNLKYIENCIEKKEILHGKIKGLESYRNSVIGKIAKKLDVSVDCLTVSKLKKRIPGKETDEIVDLFDHYQGKIKKFKNLFKKNKLLVEWSLESVHSSMEVIMKAGARGSYKSNGEMTQSLIPEKYLRIKV